MQIPHKKAPSVSGVGPSNGEPLELTAAAVHLHIFTVHFGLGVSTIKRY